MKQCPKCSRTYSDGSITFCLEDGALLSAPFPTRDFEKRTIHPPPTLVMNPQQPAVTQPAQSTITAAHGSFDVPRRSESPVVVEDVKVVSRARQIQVAATSFFALFAIVGLALYGLPYYYDYMVREFGWSRTQVTSGNALSKLIVGPLFGFVAGWIVDRFGPKRLMLAGVLMASGALIGLGRMSSLWTFY